MTISQGSRRTPHRTRDRTVVRVQTRHARGQLRDCGSVDKHVIGGSQSLCPRRLLGDDGVHLGRRQAARLDDSANLIRDGTVHHEDAIHARSPVPGFHQERNGDYDIRCCGSVGCAFIRVLADQRVQDGFESLALDRGAEHQVAHARAIERAGGINERIAERASYRLDRQPAGLS